MEYYSLEMGAHRRKTSVFILMGLTIQSPSILAVQVWLSLLRFCSSAPGVGIQESVVCAKYSKCGGKRMLEPNYWSLIPEQQNAHAYKGLIPFFLKSMILPSLGTHRLKFCTGPRAGLLLV